MKIQKATIIRTVMLLIVVVNYVLKSIGKPIIEIDEGSVAELVETIITVLAIVCAWWKNNSFSENAIKADKYLQELINDRK